MVLDIYGRPAPLIDVQLETRPTFRTETPTTDGTIIVTFDVDHLAILNVYTLPASHSAVGAYTFNHPGIMYARFQVFTSFAQRVRHKAHVRL